MAWSRRARHVLAWAAACAALAGVFMLYTRPDMAMTVADRLWSCFQ